MKFGLTKKISIALASIWIAVLAGCSHDQHWEPDDPGKKAVDELIDRYVSDGAYPLLFVRLEDLDGQLIYEHGALNSELMPGRQLDKDSWIRIWSMSKIVTISLVLDLVENGTLNLDDEVVGYIPEFEKLVVAKTPDETPLVELSANSYTDSADSGALDSLPCPLPVEAVKNPMTIRHLINHQAGFYYSTTNIPCLDQTIGAANLPASNNSQDLIDRLSQQPLIQQPGGNYFYGTNITVLGIVAERATGRSLKQLVEERITNPMQISGLQYGLPKNAMLPPYFSGADGTLRVAGKKELDIFGSSLPTYEPDGELYLGGEGMVATADGYADFVRMLLRRGELNGVRLLDEKTVEDMTSPQTQLDNEYGYNGYNLWINNGKIADGSAGRGGLWIGGGYEGTHFWVDPEYQFVGVIMTQMFSPPESGQGMQDRIREAVYQHINFDRERGRP